jgi:hypothetical protein
MIKALSSLAGDVSGFQRLDARLSRGELVAAASVPLPLGLWFNVSAVATGKHAGFPNFHLKIGRVRFPYLVGRWIVSLGRVGLNLNGANIPPLDNIFKQVLINEDDLVAVVFLPPNSNIIDSAISAKSREFDNHLVSDIVCRLAIEQERDPITDLASLTHRAFSAPVIGDTVEHNRATFLAMAFVVVGPRAHPLAPKAAELTAKCPLFRQVISLHHREDLAKHWSFSAAITSVLGDQPSTNLGEWKELSDSLPEGSGFSFVDLAADRSGTRYALRGNDPETARMTIDFLKQASEQDLLPARLLENPEGLSELSFKQLYGALEEKRYRSLVARIDRDLARDGNQNSSR